MDFNDMVALKFLDSHWAAAFWVTEKDRTKIFFANAKTVNTNSHALSGQIFPTGIFIFVFFENLYILCTVCNRLCIHPRRNMRQVCTLPQYVHYSSATARAEFPM